MKKDEQVIKDFHGRIIGFIETDSQGNKTVRDYYRRILGFYNKKLNVTQDFNKRVVATGDVCANFLTFK